jgi:hypothetical protein
MDFLKHQNFLHELFDGNRAAVALCGATPTLLNNRHKEKYRDDTLWIALFDITGNPLYVENRIYIEPILKNLMFSWETADEIEDDNPECALAMRQQSAIGFVTAVLYVLRGRDAVIEKRAHIATFMYEELNSSCVDKRRE